MFIIGMQELFPILKCYQILFTVLLNKKKVIYILDGLRVSKLRAHFHFGVINHIIFIIFILF